MITPPGALSAGLLALAEELGGQRLGREVERLRDGYRDPLRSPAAMTPTAANAYAVYRMPATYAAVRAALEQTTAAAPSLEPRSVIDLGGGSGAAAWALADAFPSAPDVRVLDRDRHMLETGRRLVTGTGLERTRWDLGDVTGELGTADLAVAAYSLGELTATDRARALDRMVAAAPNGLVVEPGTPRGFAVVLAARAAAVAAGRSLAAPCPGPFPCPMARNDWCHFSVRLPRSAAHRRAKGGELGYEDEKFSFVSWTTLPVEPAPARIVRHPQFRSGHVRLELCTDGRIERRTVTRSDKASYRAARDAEWGDRWADGAPPPVSS